MKKILTLLLAVALIAGFMPVMAKADNVSKTVYLTITDDDQYINYTNGIATPTVMAFQEITVPYFDIGEEYGLEDFYYASENYNPDDPDEPSSDLEPGTAEYAEGKITMLHLFIYAMERFYLGLQPSACGQGALMSEFGDTIDIGGTTGSLFFNSYWGMDYNLNYFLGYKYPLASSGWGATADQILLDDGDIITMTHFSDLDFYYEPTGTAGFAKPTGNNDPFTAIAHPSNNEVSLTFYHSKVDWYNTYNTTYPTARENTPIYYINTSNLVGNNASGDVQNDWTRVHTTNYKLDEYGNITISTLGWSSGTYVVSMPGLYGTYVNDDLDIDTTDNISCSPGGILVVIN